MTTTAHRTSPHRSRSGASAVALACALVVGTSACTGAATEPEGTTGPAVTSTTPDPAPTTDADTDAGTGSTPTTAADGAGLLDGSRQVDVRTYAGEWVTTTVEGGVTTVTDPAEAGGVPTTWVVEPLDGGAFHVRTTATTDGRSSCLSLPAEDVVTVAPCDPAAGDQQLDVATLDRPDQVSISSAVGVVVADPEGGLAVAPDPSSPAAVLVLVDQGAAEG